MRPRLGERVSVDASGVFGVVCDDEGRSLAVDGAPAGRIPVHGTGQPGDDCLKHACACPMVRVHGDVRSNRWVRIFLAASFGGGALCEGTMAELKFRRTITAGLVAAALALPVGTPRAVDLLPLLDAAVLDWCDT